MANIIATDRATFEAQPRLSNASKMPCKSWSLEAGATCPGAKNDPLCAGCYAQKGRYTMPNVAAVRQHNREDWKNADWVPAMIEAIGKRKKFRWFDSGDMYHIALARKILAVCKATPNTQHWIPTRMYKFEKFAPVLAELAALPNVVVRHSTSGIDTAPVEAPNASIVVSSAERAAEHGAHLCPAYSTAAGKCRTSKCFACWDKRVKVIAYPYH